jgi:hypothetical protein
MNRQAGGQGDLMANYQNARATDLARSRMEEDRKYKIRQMNDASAKTRAETQNALIKEPNSPFRMGPDGQMYNAQTGEISAGGQKRAPAGYAFNPGDNSMKAIPGGPADFKQQGMYNADTASLQGNFADLDRLGIAAKKILENTDGLDGITGITGKFPDIPGSTAANARADLASLKAQVGFGVLQAMRNNSKTGGALGNVSDAEGKRLEAALGSLETAQSTEQFKERLQGIVDFSTGAKDRLAGAYNLKYNPTTQAGGQSARQADSALSFGGNGGTPSGINPPSGAVTKLRGNPALATDFDRKYGQGAAARVLGK